MTDFEIEVLARLDAVGDVLVNADRWERTVAAARTKWAEQRMEDNIEALKAEQQRSILRDTADDPGLPNPYVRETGSEGRSDPE